MHPIEGTKRATPRMTLMMHMMHRHMRREAYGGEAMRHVTTTAVMAVMASVSSHIVQAERSACLDCEKPRRKSNLSENCEGHDNAFCIIGTAFGNSGAN